MKLPTWQKKAVLLLVWGLLFPGMGQSLAADYRESFNKPELSAWELSPGAAVRDGELHLEAGGMAMLLGSNVLASKDHLTLIMRIRLTGDGKLVVSYRLSEKGVYLLLLGKKSIILQRESGDKIQDLGEAAFETSASGNWFQLGLNIEGTKHYIIINGKPVLTITDPKPLPAGSVSFETLDTAMAVIDDVELISSGAAQTPVKVKSPPGKKQAALPAGSSLKWVRTGGPPGGLGYDIRYNFANPDTWYVTDNFAGVHISTDNGATWKPANNGIPPQAGPTGDMIPIFSLTVDHHNPKTVWAGTSTTGHIYKSTDGGQSWVQSDNGVTIKYGGGLTFRGFTVDPHSSGIVYAMAETSDPEKGKGVWGPGTGGAIYKTTDGGKHWQLIWDGGMPSSLARYMWIDPRDSKVLYVSTGIFDRGAVGEGNPATAPFGGLGILKSIDGGKSWRKLGKANGLGMLYIGSLFMHPKNPDVLLAAAGHIFGEHAQEYLEVLVRKGHSPAGIYRTSDGGEHWKQVISPPPERIAEAFTAVEFCPSNPDIAYAGSATAVYRSKDAGKSWKLVSGDAGGWGPPAVVAGFPIDLQCDPRDPKRVFANNYNGGNFLSEDGGRTWKNASQGYTGAQVIGVSVDPTDPARVYVAARSGLWRSNNGGKEWSGLYHPPADHHVFGLEWMAVEHDPSKSGHVLAGNSGGVILESRDGGSTWKYRWAPKLGGKAGGASAIIYAPSDPSTVYAGICGDGCLRMHEPCFDIGYGVIVSHDGGTSWKRAGGSNFAKMPVIDLAVDPKDAKVVYAATETGLYKSADGGGNWKKLAGLPEKTRVRTVAANPSSSKHILAGVDGLGVYVSLNGGQTWQKGHAGLEPNGSLHDTIFDPTNSKIAYASDYRSGVYRSTDGGLSWKKINKGLRNRAALGLSISKDGRHLYVSTDGEGVFRLDLDGKPPAKTATAPKS